jgi:hypothetical protein
MEFWVSLWTVLLWGSAVAFGLVTLYIVTSAALNAFKRRD